jgi:aspartyl-tRNA(Asn)/glutamyl-tRNA(Gln) amidotransferase subunit A
MWPVCLFTTLINGYATYQAGIHALFACAVDFRSPYTATAIELLQDAGVITGGKANMDEFGMG